jgi:hypothetical protein
MNRLRVGSKWLRRSDSNRRPSGYEPDELPLLHSAMGIIPPGLLAPTFSGGQGAGVPAGPEGVGDGGGATR